MPRVIGAFALALALASAYALYAVSISTRKLERQVQALERERERLVSDLKVLKGERAFHMRPDRIEPLARLQGLEPLKRDQIVTREELDRRLP